MAEHRVHGFLERWARRCVDKTCRGPCFDNARGAVKVTQGVLRHRVVFARADLSDVPPSKPVVEEGVDGRVAVAVAATVVGEGDKQDTEEVVVGLGSESHAVCSLDDVHRVRAAFAGHADETLQHHTDAARRGVIHHGAKNKTNARELSVRHGDDISVAGGCRRRPFASLTTLGVLAEVVERQALHDGLHHREDSEEGIRNVLLWAVPLDRPTAVPRTLHDGAGVRDHHVVGVAYRCRVEVDVGLRRRTAAVLPLRVVVEVEHCRRGPTRGGDAPVHRLTIRPLPLQNVCVRCRREGVVLLGDRREDDTVVAVVLLVRVMAGLILDEVGGERRQSVQRVVRLRNQLERRRGVATAHLGGHAVVVGDEMTDKLNAGVERRRAVAGNKLQRAVRTRAVPSDVENTVVETTFLQVEHNLAVKEDASKRRRVER
eukprot:PhM_4_TR12301/c0_g1_i1/m.76775